MATNPINTAGIILTDLNFWDIPDTFYESSRFSSSAAVYRFGCNQQKTTFKVKIDEALFMAENITG